MKPLTQHRDLLSRPIGSTTLAVSLILCLLGVQTASAATFSWANTNVWGAAPASPLDWFSGGPNTQGVWIGGIPSDSSYWTTVSIFQDATTSLENTSPSGNVQTINLNTNGVPFQLRFLWINGKASETPGADLAMTLSGDPLHFSNTTSPIGGTIDVSGVNNVQTLSYDVANPIIIGTAGGNGKLPLYVQGSGSAELVISGPISELQAGGGRVVKQGVNTVTLSGDSSISGGVEASGGTLRLTGTNTSGTNRLDLKRGNVVFDLSAGNDRWSGSGASPTPYFSGGTLTVKGAPTGTSSQTLTGVMFPNSVKGQSKIIVDSNGGAGTTLNLGSDINSEYSSWGCLLIDKSTAGAVVLSNKALKNELIMFDTNQNGRAGILVKDSTGTGFATAVAGEIVRYTGAEVIQPTSSSETKNFKTSGPLTTLTGADKQHYAHTLELDASDGDGILDLGTGKIGTVFLMAGANDYTIENGKVDGIIHHFGTGTLTIDAIVSWSLRKYGPGRVILNGANTLVPAGDGISLTIYDGVVQAIDGIGMPTNQIFRFQGGVFQSSGNLFPRTINATSPYNAPKVAWNSSGQGGGFAAQGGTFTVSLNAGAALTWGSGVFVQNEQALIFGSTSADSLLDWQNGIDLGSAVPNGHPTGSWLMREVRVDDNPASTTDIAQMSGALTGAVGGLIKTGEGTLSLTAANTYGGSTIINAGTLLVNGSLNTADSPVTVKAGGTLGGSGTVIRPVTLYADATLNGSLGLTCGTNVTMKSGTKIAWDSKATGTVTVNGVLTLPATASVTFGSVPAGQLVLFESPNAIVGSAAGWTVTPSLITIRVSADGKKVFASSGGSLMMLR